MVAGERGARNGGHKQTSLMRLRSYLQIVHLVVILVVTVEESLHILHVVPVDPFRSL